jgi:predicted DNA-binding protein
MMTTTLEAPNALKSPEHLERLFHVLMTPSMYAEIETLSENLNISKASVIRTAIEEYFCKLQDDDRMDYCRKMEDQYSCEQQDLESPETT